MEQEITAVEPPQRSNLHSASWSKLSINWRKYARVNSVLLSEITDHAADLPKKPPM